MANGYQHPLWNVEEVCYIYVAKCRVGGGGGLDRGEGASPWVLLLDAPLVILTSIAWLQFTWSLTRIDLRSTAHKHRR